MLLDTHVLLWFVMDDARLSTRASKSIANAKTTKFLSMASLWEIAIKVNVGKLNLGVDLPTFVQQWILSKEIELLPVNVDHCLQYQSLPLHHRDPFDRLLVAQSLVENLPLVTGDSRFRTYSIETIW